MAGSGPNDVHSAASERGAGRRGQLHPRRRGRRSGRPSSRRTVAGAGLGSQPVRGAHHAGPGGDGGGARPRRPRGPRGRRPSRRCRRWRRARRPRGSAPGRRAAGAARTRPRPARRNTARARSVDPGGQGGVGDQGDDGGVGAHAPRRRPRTTARVQAMPPRSPSSNSRLPAGQGEPVEQARGSRRRRRRRRRASPAPCRRRCRRSSGTRPRSWRRRVRRRSVDGVTGAGGRRRRPRRTRCRCPTTVMPDEQADSMASSAVTPSSAAP